MTSEADSITPALLTTIVQTVVRKETDDIRSDIKVIREVQALQSSLLKRTQSDVNSLKSSFRKQVANVRGMSILLEDLEHRFEAGSELG